MPETPPVDVAYIDDQEREPTRYAERLSSSGTISCRVIDPPALDELRAFMVEHQADLYLIDQDLSDKRGYLGSGLAAHIRSEAPDYPVVLVSRRTVLNEAKYGRPAEGFDDVHVVDDLFLKAWFNRDLERVVHTLVGLAEGYASLRKRTGGSRNAALRWALTATDEEIDAVREASPPVGTAQWQPFPAARWIRHTLLAYPGPLLGPLHAAVLLGITQEAFENERVQDVFSEARYAGLFAPYEGRWWRGRLLSVATKLVAEAELRGPVRSNLRIALGEDTPLPAPICVWDGTEGAEAVCYVLHEPVKLSHSLRYYPDTRPSVMDPARVSYRAIYSDDSFDEELLDSSGQDILEQVSGLPDPIADPGT